MYDTLDAAERLPCLLRFGERKVLKEQPEAPKKVQTPGKLPQRT